MNISELENEERILEKERICYENELKWVLDSEWPYFVENETSLLRSTLEVLLEAGTNALNSLPLSSTNSETVKGYVAVSGNYLTKGEINLKLQNLSRGSHFKVSFASGKRFLLDQIQDARSYLTYAVDNLKGCQRYSDKKAIMNVLKEVMKYIQESKLAIQVPPHELFPQTVCDLDLFEPELPGELRIGFHISKAMLITTLYYVKYHNHQGSNTGIKLLHKHKAHMKYVKCQDKIVEIVDSLTLESGSPKWLTFLDRVEHCENLCSEMITRLNLF